MMKQRFQELSDAAVFVMQDSPGLSGAELSAEVMKELEDYGMIDANMAITQEEVFDALDIMIEDGEVFFDTAEDAWYLADSPEGVAAMRRSAN